jgi:methionyl-tRNA formyltransferase
LKVIFFGSDEFALEPLNALLASGHQVVGVVGRPERPAGRGLKPVSTAVVSRANTLDLRVWQPQDLTSGSFASTAGEVSWDAGVVVGYGGLIPGWLLEYPTYGFVNLHPSLLPRYRGAAPVERALMKGAGITGVTTIKMNDRLDAGDIFMHRETPISEDDTTGTLGERLGHLGANLLVETLDGIEGNDMKPVAQDEDKATDAPPVKPEEANIDWQMTAESIDALVRALDPAPGAYTFFRGGRLKIWSVQVTEVPQEAEPGALMNMGKEGFLVNTGTNCVGVVTVQPEGRKRMSAGEFSRGQRLLIGERFTGRAES